MCLCNFNTALPRRKIKVKKLNKKLKIKVKKKQWNIKDIVMPFLSSIHILGLRFATW